MKIDPLRNQKSSNMLMHKKSINIHKLSLFFDQKIFFFVQKYLFLWGANIKKSVLEI